MTKENLNTTENKKAQEEKVMKKFVDEEYYLKKNSEEKLNDLYELRDLMTEDITKYCNDEMLEKYEIDLKYAIWANEFKGNILKFMYDVNSAYILEQIKIFSSVGDIKTLKEYKENDIERYMLIIASFCGECLNMMYRTYSAGIYSINEKYKKVKIKYADFKCRIKFPFGYVVKKGEYDAQDKTIEIYINEDYNIKEHVGWFCGLDNRLISIKKGQGLKFAERMREFNKKDEPQEEKIMKERECKITNEDVAELVLSVDNNEEDIIKYFPYAKEKSDIEKLELLIEAKHKKLGIDWPTGEFEPLKANLDAEHREIIPDAWMAELYRIAIIERADFSSEDIIKEETNSYEKFLNFIDENSATELYDHILGRKDSDGWYSYADAKECEIIASYRKKDIALTLSEFNQDCNTLDAIDAVIKKASLDENMNKNKDFHELMWLVNSIRKNILRYYDFYFVDETKRADLYDRECDDEAFEYIFTHEYTMNGYGGFIYSGWFVLDLISLIENAAARTARYVEDEMFEIHDIKYEDRNYIFGYMY